ncbi:MAG: hypothetical protein WCI05_06360, partial [Myxococcales bacterium]
MRRPPLRMTLVRVFVATTLGIAVLMAALLYVFLIGSRAAILETANQLRQAAALHVEERVRGELGNAERVIEHIEREVDQGVLVVDDPRALELRLYSELVDSPRIAE